MAGRIGETVGVFLIDQWRDGTWSVEMEELGLPGRLAGPFDGEPGDRVEVEIASVDPDRGRLDFSPPR